MMSLNDDVKASIWNGTKAARESEIAKAVAAERRAIAAQVRVLLGLYPTDPILIGLMTWIKARGK